MRSDGLTAPKIMPVRVNCFTVGLMRSLIMPRQVSQHLSNKECPLRPTGFR